MIKSNFINKTIKETAALLEKSASELIPLMEDKVLAAKIVDSTRQAVLTGDVSELLKIQKTIQEQYASISSK